MTVLDANQYADPMLVLERKQEQQLKKVAACGDCIHVKMIFQGQPRCTVRFQTFGYRCTNYEKVDKHD